MSRYYKLRPSRLLAVLLILLCLAAFVMLWLLPLPDSLRSVLAGLVSGWGGYHMWSDAAMRQPSSCVAFRLDEGGVASLMLRNGAHLAGMVRDDSLVLPWMVILLVDPENSAGRRRLLIMPDVMSEDSFRRLRMELRWRLSTSQAGV